MKTLIKISLLKHKHNQINKEVVIHNKFQILNQVIIIKCQTKKKLMIKVKVKMRKENLIEKLMQVKLRIKQLISLI